MKNNQHSVKEELAELGWDFGQVPNAKLEVPSGYFEDSKGQMLDNILALDFAEALPKSMPQSVPDGYFEQSKQEILANTVQAEPAQQLVYTKRRTRQNWALAATMALIVSLGLFFMNPNTKTQSIEAQLSQIPSEIIDGYIEENAYDFEALDILENPQMTTRSLRNLEQEILNETKTLSDEEIFEYVL